MGNPGTLLIHVLSPITFLDEVYIHSVLLVRDSRNMGHLQIHGS
jgi:hypothetical protein